MIFLPSHVFTPAALVADPTWIRIVPAGELSERCVACDMPSGEHLDEAVLASYAAAVQSGAEVSRLLSCGHRGPVLSPASTIWLMPARGVLCNACSGISAVAEYAAGDSP